MRTGSSPVTGTKLEKSMPAVAITGATSGIGLEIKKYFLKKNYLIQEFNRTNNFDIAKKSEIGRAHV